MKKPAVSRFQIGDTVVARVIEILSPQIFIVSFYGDLLRVRNHSQRRLCAGDEVELQVIATRPLQFQMPGRSLSDRHFSRRA